MASSDNAFSYFVRELRRRRVFRTAGLYIVGGWLTMQAADVFFPAWGLPDAALNVLLVTAIMGFPLALIFGWRYDITPHGIVRTPSAGEIASDAPQPLQRNDYLVLGALVLIAAVIVYDGVKNVLDAPGVAVGFTETGGPIERAEKPSNSIAVLPFANLSNDPANESFCDGISEELLHKLSAFPELHVIGRTSSFAFKNSDYGIPRIASVLGVRFLLQGSVRKEGKKLRILAQLVDDSGTQMWSNSFERELDSIFAIQSEVSNVVASTVVPKIVPPPHSQYQPDLVAYQFFLEGRELLHKRDFKARESLAEATRRDPNYPEAHAELAIALALHRPGVSEIEQAQQAIDRALALEPKLARTLAAQGLVLAHQHDADDAAAELLFRQALERDPSMVDAMIWLGGQLSGHGREEESDELLERALSIDPLHPTIAANLSSSYKRQGDSERAEQLLLNLMELPNPPRYAYTSLRHLYLDLGRLIEMNAIEKKLALTGLNVYYGLAWNYAVLSDWATAAYWTERCRLDFPTQSYAWAFPYFVPYWQGRYDEAAAIFQHELVSNNKSLAKLNSMFTNWDGTVRALAGDYQGAILALESMLRLGAISNYQADERQALAWSYMHTGSPDKADALLQDIERKFARLDERGQLHGSQELFFFAQNAVLLGHHDLALGRLERAINAGWRQYYIWRNDPRWAALADNPRYVELMARVKADVDLQRAEIARLDAEEDFVAKLDAARH